VPEKWRKKNYHEREAAMDAKFCRLVKASAKRERDKARQKSPESVLSPAMARTYDKIGLDYVEGRAVHVETRGDGGYVVQTKTREVMARIERVGGKRRLKMTVTTDMVANSCAKRGDRVGEKLALRRETNDLMQQFLANGGTVNRL
jgi:hypothetical protein